MNMTFNDINNELRRRDIIGLSQSKYFSNLFINTYWANCSPLNYDTEKILCQNRNIIAKRYDLKKRIKTSSIPKKYYNKIIIYNYDEIEKIKQKYNNPIYSQKDRDRYLKNYIKNCLNNWDIFNWARDHIEYYETKDGKIASIFSKNSVSTENNKYFIEKNNYILIESIYDLDQNTYIKIIEKE